MNRNKNTKEVSEERYSKKSYSKQRPKGKSRRNNKRDTDVTTPTENSSSMSHSNAAIWYYTDTEIMEQASRLSFQNIYGLGTPTFGDDALEPTTAIFYLNPSPGVTFADPSSSAPYTYSFNGAGINLASFKLYTQLSMASGRTATYAPQNITTLILQLGELISNIEWARRFFGIAFTYNQRNRVWPKDVIDMLGINSSDFFANLANYRMRLNTLITRVKQIPIPENIGYFHKCEMLYQSAYTDSTSPLAQVYAFNPATTWLMDETYAGGTALITKELCLDITTNYATRVNFSTYLSTVLEPMVDALLSSSTLNVIYADILNYASKSGAKFWEFDYVSEAYAVAPEYNADMLEIIHNIIQVGDCPIGVPGSYNRAADYSTPANDVYPDPSNNGLIYNPKFGGDVFPSFYSGDVVDASTFTENIVVDLANADASLDVRLDVMEYKAVPYDAITYPGDAQQMLRFILPDHYCIVTRILSNYSTTSDGYLMGYGGCKSVAGSAMPRVFISSAPSRFDWMYLVHAVSRYSSGGVDHIKFQALSMGDLNYNTKVDGAYMERLLKLTYLGLFELRQGKR